MDTVSNYHLNPNHNFFTARIIFRNIQIRIIMAVSVFCRYPPALNQRRQRSTFHGLYVAESVYG